MLPEAHRRRVRERPHASQEIPKYQGFKTDMREFEGMDFLGQLKYSFQISLDKTYDIKERRVIRTKAVLKTLETDPQIRADNDVRIIAHGDVDARRRVHTEFPEFSMYSVYVSFAIGDEHKYQTGSKDNEIYYNFVSTNNLHLRDELPEGTDVDQIVNYQADAVREETLFEKHKRLILEIKALDTDIYRRRSGIPYPRKLNNKELRLWKNRRIMEYLEISLELQDEYPEIAMNYFMVNQDESGRTRLALKTLTDKYFYMRLGKPSAAESLRESDSEMSTGLSIDELLTTYKNFIQDPVGISGDAEISVGICRMLGLDARQTKIATPEAIAVPTQAHRDEVESIATRDTSGTEIVLTEREESDVLPAAILEENSEIAGTDITDDLGELVAEEVTDSGETVVYPPPVKKKQKVVLSNAARRRLKKDQTKTKNWKSTIDSSSQTEDVAVAQAGSTTPPARKARREPAQASEMMTVSYTELAERFGLVLPSNPMEARIFETTVDDFLDVFITGKDGNEISYLRQLQFIRYLDNINPVMARGKTARIVDDVISLPPDKRQALGIYAVAIGDVTSEDPLYGTFPQIHQYEINLIYSANGQVQMISASRGDLVAHTKNKVTKTLAYIDNRVAASVETIPESPVDRYKRLVTEIHQIDALLAEQRRQVKLHSFKIMGEVPGREAKQLAFRDSITALTDIKKSIVLQSLQAAEALQATSGLDSLYLIREGETESSLFISLREIEEKNRALRILGVQPEPELVIRDYLPEIPVMLKKERAQAQTARAATSADTANGRLAFFVREREERYQLAPFTENIPPGLQTFSQLPLQDQITQASQDQLASRKGEVATVLAQAERRIVMRNLLRVSQEVRDRHDVRVMVSGPKVGRKVVIQGDIDYSQYSVFMIYPEGSRKAYMEESRSTLAGNPYMNLEAGAIRYIPNRKDLISLDAAVNAANPYVRPDTDDLYMRHRHTVAAIQSVDNQIKALRDLDITREEKLRRTTVLFMRKVPYLLTYIENAHIWQQKRPEFGQLYTVEPTRQNDTFDLALHLLSDINSHSFVTQNTGPNERNVIQTGSPKRTPIYANHLRVAKDSFEKGYEDSDIIGAAAAVYDLLDLQSLAA